MTQERKALMDKEAFRLYPTFVQDREIFRRGFEYADNNPDHESFNKRLKLEKEEWLDKAIEWMQKEVFIVYSNTTIVEEKIKEFRRYMEEK